MNIRDQLTTYVVEECLQRRDGYRLSPNEQLLGHGVIDSMQMLQLTQFIEDRFGVSIADEDLVMDNFQTIGHITAFIERKQSA